MHMVAVNPDADIMFLRAFGTFIQGSARSRRLALVVRWQKHGDGVVRILLDTGLLDH